MTLPPHLRVVQSMSVRKTWVLAGLLAASVVPSIVCAQARPPVQAVRAPAIPPPNSPPAVRITPAAQDAVVVVTRFFDALSKGDLATAREQLDPGVVVITNATIRGGRDAYMAEQARADADFLKQSQRGLLRRDAQADGQLAWVLSEKVFRTGKGPDTRTVETIVLAKNPGGWKIVHIHWSTRPLVGR